MIRILTWLWRIPECRTQYRAEHVNTWAAMIRRNITMDHTIACVTDIPEGIDPSIEIIDLPRDFVDVRIPTWGERLPQCLRRLAMYRPDAADIFGERFVSMDLDCVIGGSLDPLFDVNDDIKLYKGTSRSRPYNGSMQLMTAGARSQVYTEFTPERAAEAGKKYLGSDQAWISHCLGAGEATWDLADGVAWWGARHQSPIPDRRIMFFPGHPKPWDCPWPDADTQWVQRHYRQDMQEAA